MPFKSACAKQHIAYSTNVAYFPVGRHASLNSCTHWFSPLRRTCVKRSVTPRIPPLRPCPAVDAVLAGRELGRGPRVQPDATHPVPSIEPSQAVSPMVSAAGPAYSLFPPSHGGAFTGPLSLAPRTPVGPAKPHRGPWSQGQGTCKCSSVRHRRRPYSGADTFDC